MRHPMYTAALLFVWAAVVSHVSVLTLAIGIAVTVVSHSPESSPRNDCCIAKYPEYQDYIRSTKALVPYLF